MVRVGIIGGGGMGRGHAHDIAEHCPDAQVVAVCDSNPEIAASFPNCQFYHFAEGWPWLEMMSNIDAAIVCTPHNRHYIDAASCIDVGKHVLVEKPMTLRGSEARNLTVASKDADRVLAVGFQRHGEPLFRKAKEVVASGEIGEVRFVRAYCSHDATQAHSSGWRADPKQVGRGGHACDTGAHIIDAALWIAGIDDIAEVSSQAQFEGLPVPINMAIQVRSTTGALASITIVGTSEEWFEEYEFTGTKGWLRLSLRDECVVIKPHGEKRQWIERVVCGLDKSACQNFIDAILGRAEVQATGLDGLRVAKVLEKL